MKQLGSCCNCGVTIFEGDYRATWYGPPPTHACEKCDRYSDEVLIFIALLSCCMGKKSWDVFKTFKEDYDNQIL
jgi:hypothetical protein